MRRLTPRMLRRLLGGRGRLVIILPGDEGDKSSFIYVGIRDSEKFAALIPSRLIGPGDDNIIIREIHVIGPGLEDEVIRGYFTISLSELKDRRDVVVHIES